MEELWSRAESLLGPVHCLVNNAGVTIITMIDDSYYYEFLMRMILGTLSKPFLGPCRDDHDDDL